jgi:CheY-like chemotaxis protein
VLHVDDDNSILTVTKSIIESEGAFEVESTSSVDDALNKIKNGNYDVIVSDYEMPIRNGLDF